MPPGAGIYVDSRYAGTTPVVVPRGGLGHGRGIEAVGQNGQRYREERTVVAGADEILTIDLEAEARRQAGRQQASQEEQAGSDFILFVLITMVMSVIAPSSLRSSAAGPDRSDPGSCSGQGFSGTPVTGPPPPSAFFSPSALP